MRVQVTDLTFGYMEATPVLEGITFFLHDAESIAVVGASGTGKSTLLRLVAGLLPRRPSRLLRGRIDLLESENVPVLPKPGTIGFMFQTPVLLAHQTVLGNVALALVLCGAERREAEPLAMELLARVGLAQVAHQLPRTLSLGMQTRVALARTFATRPRLLLLDEPFAALDVGWRVLLYQMLQDLRHLTGASMVLVTHDVREALLLADRVLVLGSSGTLAGEHGPFDRSSLLPFEPSRAEMFLQSVEVAHSAITNFLVAERRTLDAR